MLSLRRLGYVLLIVLGICGIFTLYNINEKNNKTISIRKPLIEERMLLVSEEVIEKQAIHFYVLGNDEKEIYKDICRNVCQLMQDLKLSWSRKEKLLQKDFNNQNAVFIFCDDRIGGYADLQELAEFIHNGGRAVFAAGIAEGYEDAYLQPVLGIIEKTVKENYNEFSVAEGFFPLQSQVMLYDGYNVSLWLNVRKNARIYMKDYEKEVPIVYIYPYGHGEALVINATMLSDSRNTGILMAGLGELLDELVYPMIGTECIFLDNFPMVTYVNDSACMKRYGRTTEAFIRDVVWSVFQGMAVRNALRYTSGVLSISGEEKSFPAITESLFPALGKSALQYNGEIAYAANYDGEALYKNDAFIDSFEETFPNYEIETLVMVNGQSIPKVIEAFGRDIKVVRGKLSESSQENRMAVLKEYAVFPEATAGKSLHDGNMLAIASVLAGYGMVSHTFDMNTFLNMDEREADWDADKIQLSEFEKEIFGKTEYLQRASLSETRAVMESYLGMEYGWSKEGNTIELRANRMIEEQPFWFRTKGRIIRAEGAEYIEAAEGYYCVRLKQTKAVFILEQKGGAV